MESSTTKGQLHRRRWLSKTVRAVGVVTVIAITATWAGVTYDHPINDAIVAGMQSSRCSAVRAMSAGSLLTSMLPDEGICRAFFLYRGNVSNASDDENTYRVSVMRDRLDEFEQLWAYVWLLTVAVASTAYVLFITGRGMRHRFFASPQSRERDGGNGPRADLPEKGKSC